MRFFVVLATLGLASAGGAPMQNFAFTTHGQGSHFTMMQKVVPQAMPSVGVAQQAVAYAHKPITVTAPHNGAMYGGPAAGHAGMSHAAMGHSSMGHPSMGHSGMSHSAMGHPAEMHGAQMAMDHGAGPGMAMGVSAKSMTLANTAMGYGAAMKGQIGYGGQMVNQGQLMAAAPMMVADKGHANGPYAGISVGLVADKGAYAGGGAHFSAGAPMAHGAQTSYAAGPLGTYSAEKASLASLPGKGFIQGQPFEMVTSQKTFFAGPGGDVGYGPANGAAMHGGAQMMAAADPKQYGHAGQAMSAAPHGLAQGGHGAMAMAPSGAPAHSPYGADFAFAEKIFASAPAGLYSKPYATSPLATKSMMIK